MVALPDTLQKTIRSFLRKKERARDTGNEANRYKTLTKNAMNDWLKKENLAVGTIIGIDGYELRYAPSEDAGEIPIELWFKEYEKNNITKEQLMRALKVSKSEAANIIGQDWVERYKEPPAKPNVDVRVKELDVATKHPYVKEPDKPTARIRPRQKKAEKPARRKVRVRT